MADPPATRLSPPTPASSDASSPTPRSRRTPRTPGSNGPLSTPRPPDSGLAHCVPPSPSRRQAPDQDTPPGLTRDIAALRASVTPVRTCPGSHTGTSRPRVEAGPTTARPVGPGLPGGRCGTGPPASSDSSGASKEARHSTSSSPRWEGVLRPLPPPARHALALDVGLDGQCSTTQETPAAPKTCRRASRSARDQTRSPGRRPTPSAAARRPVVSSSPSTASRPGAGSPRRTAAPSTRRSSGAARAARAPGRGRGWSCRRREPDEEERGVATRPACRRVRDRARGVHPGSRGRPRCLPEVGHRPRGGDEAPVRRCGVS